MLLFLQLRFSLRSSHRLSSMPVNAISAATRNIAAKPARLAMAPISGPAMPRAELRLAAGIRVTASTSRAG
ncbi:hypothetical protein D3C86_2164820 [compost metagenome]